MVVAIVRWCGSRGRGHGVGRGGNSGANDGRSSYGEGGEMVMMEVVAIVIEVKVVIVEKTVVMAR